MITINYHVIAPVCLIVCSSTYSLNNCTPVILGFPRSDLLHIPELFCYLYSSLQICNLFDRLKWYYSFSLAIDFKIPYKPFKIKSINREMEHKIWFLLSFTRSGYILEIVFKGIFTEPLDFNKKTN